MNATRPTKTKTNKPKAEIIPTRIRYPQYTYTSITKTTREKMREISIKLGKTHIVVVGELVDAKYEEIFNK